MKKVLLILLISSFFVGCSTTYQPNGRTGGYSDQQLEDDVFRVNFYGNGFTSITTVEDFLTFRSAEITLQNGYNYFANIESKNNESNSYSLKNNGTINETTKHTSYRTIKLYKTKPNNIDVRDANQIIKYMGPMIAGSKETSKKRKSLTKSIILLSIPIAISNAFQWPPSLY